MTPIWDGSTPASASAFAPGHRRRVGEGHVLRPPAALAYPGQLLEHPRAHPDPLVGRGQPLVELRPRWRSTGASTPQTDRTLVLFSRYVALPIHSLPSTQSVRS